MIKRFMKDNNGQTLVEFALVLPVLLLLFLGMMEAGRLFAGYIELESAARDGARYAAVHTSASDADLQTVMKGRLVMLDDTKVTFDIDRKSDTSTGEKWTEITLDYPMDIITPLIGDIIGDPVNLSSKMTMRTE